MWPSSYQLVCHFATLGPEESPVGWLKSSINLVSPASRPPILEILYNLTVIFCHFKLFAAICRRFLSLSFLFCHFQVFAAVCSHLQECCCRVSLHTSVKKIIGNNSVSCQLGKVKKYCEIFALNEQDLKSTLFCTAIVAVIQNIGPVDFCCDVEDV